MKRLFTAALLSITIAGIAQNQKSPLDPKREPAPAPTQAMREAPSPEQEGMHETMRMNKLVSLGQNMKKVQDVNTSFYARNKEIYGKAKNYGETNEAQKQKLKELSETYSKELEAAMGKDLYEKYRAAEKNMINMEHKNPPVPAKK
jgi:hypothetical protein